MSRPFEGGNDYFDHDDESYDGLIEDPIYNDELDEDRDAELDLLIWDVCEDNNANHYHIFDISQNNDFDEKIIFDECQGYEEDAPIVSNEQTDLLEGANMTNDNLKGANVIDCADDEKYDLQIC